MQWQQSWLLAGSGCNWQGAFQVMHSQLPHVRLVNAWSDLLLLLLLLLTQVACGCCCNGKSSTRCSISQLLAVHHRHASHTILHVLVRQLRDLLVLIC